MDTLTTLPLLSLVNALRSGELPLEAYVDRLEQQYELREPLVQAFVPEERRFERLRREAAALGELFPNPLNRPPLFGVPVGIKDIFHVDGFPTLAGSQLPAAILHGRESRVATIFKESGALIMGKTVTTEFAYFDPGPTRNPRNLAHTPGGSSSGSAAAVAAGLCPIATGSQTIGSITRPAAYCGVVGYKPTYDRVSRNGVIPLSPSLDHVGFFASDVAGAELVASLVCPDWQLAVPEEQPVIGIPEGPYLERASAEALAQFEAACERLESFGCVLKRVPVMANFENIVARHNVILAAEAAQVHADWFSEFSNLYHHKMIDLIERGRRISVGDLAEAITGRQRLRQALIAAMDQHALDLWVSPSATGPAPEGLESTGDPIMNLPWTHSGLPTVNLPSAYDSAGLPYGLQVAGRWYEDEMLLEWCAELETVVCS